MRLVMKRIIFVVLLVFNVMVFLFSNHLAVLSNPKAAAAQEQQDIVYVICVSGNSQQDSATPTPGEYLMEVKNVDDSTGADEVKNPPIRVIVIHQFWKTWWFKSLSLLAAGTIFLSLYRMRRKYIAVKINQGENIGCFFSRHHLSCREQEIALFLLKGETNDSIENKLFISAHTVKNHIYNIYRKLGVKNRMQLANLCRDFL
ncbi:MAG: LuxR family transcriptional regulator, positive regulator of biofilm formation [Acidobacteriota bacterium]|nr:LuxR family transcriptional regulator, positive regulator of biofilm formation [Acidobacteriota bacterium]